MLTDSMKKLADTMFRRLDEALEQDQDERDDLRITAARSTLLYAVSTGDDERVGRELAKLQPLWAVWATTGKWQVLPTSLEVKAEEMFGALDAASVTDLDDDDDLRIAAARSRLVYAMSTEDVERVERELAAIEAERVVWATSGRWPAMIIKPSGPPREEGVDDLDLAKQIDADWTAARWLWGGALALGAYIAFRPRTR